MTVEQDTTVRASAESVTGCGPATADQCCNGVSPLVGEVVERLDGSGPRFAATAPGRLDVMGGLAEYTGALVLNLPLAEHVCVAAQQRGGGELSITLAGALSGDGGTSTKFALSDFTPRPGVVVDATKGLELLGDSGNSAATCMVGVLVEALRAGLLPVFPDGLSLAAASTLHDVSCGGAEAATSVASLVAAAAVLGVKPDPNQAALACQRVENDWLGVPVGPADAVGSLLGEPNSLSEVRCDPCTLAGSIGMPDGLLIIGIDCGVKRADAMAKYVQVRTATFMGRALADRIIQHDGIDITRWDGYLSRLSVTDFVERFRDRIPTKMKGQEFLDRFGETDDSLTTIEPRLVYKIRSRMEHHIYEHARSRQLVECLSRASRTTDDRALTEAGELMYASHWSYGQRCGLGSVETDMLVNLVRKHGEKAGLYGAKVTGRGCGGVVAVLMTTSDRARSAVEEAVATYTTKTGHQAKILSGATPGALITGAQPV